MPVKVGMNIAPRHPLESSRMMLTMAEAAEVDSVWAPDHLLGTSHPDLWPDMALAPLAPNPDAFYDPFVALGLLARESSIPMGVCVTDTIRRRAPDVVRTALTLHHLCPGGFNLGIGAGEAENLVPFGYDFSTPVAETERFLVELRTLLDDGVMPANLGGRTGLPSRRDDIGSPKVWVAGHGPRMLRLTGEHGDGWLPAWPMTAATYGERLRTVRGHADRVGRPTPEAGLHAVVAFGPSRDYVADLLERDPLGKLAALICPADVWAAHGLEHPYGADCRGLVDVVFHDVDADVLRELAPKIPLELVEEFYFLGNVDEIAGRIRPYADNGLEHVVLANATGFVGGVDEITANAEQFVLLRHALGGL
jgi:phthiodiolone/phenolphthiodiolone dimycocerosates ketoreductase